MFVEFRVCLVFWIEITLGMIIFIIEKKNCNRINLLEIKDIVMEIFFVANIDAWNHITTKFIEVLEVCSRGLAFVKAIKL